MVPQAQKSAAPPVIPSPPSGPSTTHPPVYPSAESAETSRLGRDRNWEATSLLGARGFGSRRQNTPFFSQCHWEQNTPDTGGLSLLFTSLSCSPAFLEIAGKPSSTRLSCTLLSRVSGGGGAAAGGRAAEPAAFPPRVHANGACTARAASRGWPVLRRPRCPLSRMPAGR